MPRVLGLPNDLSLSQDVLTGILSRFCQANLEPCRYVPVVLPALGAAAVFLALAVIAPTMSGLALVDSAPPDPRPPRA